jgi:hypothetical protein
VFDQQGGVEPPQPWLPLLQVNVQLFPEQPAVARTGVASQQLVPQRVFVQLMSHIEEAHTAEPLAGGAVHRFPQFPQFEVSFVRFTHVLPQRVRVPQLTTQEPFSQI